MPAVKETLMYKATALLLFAGLLFGCSSTASGPRPKVQEANSQKGGCYQADWQAQTAPVINKRSGPDELGQYDAEHGDQDAGCR